MYSLAPEKLLRLVYEPFYLAILLTFYETVNLDGFWRVHQVRLPQQTATSTKKSTGPLLLLSRKNRQVGFGLDLSAESEYFVLLMKVLGIETSCDETAAAVVSDGRTILSNAVWSQVATHHPYGGVVPELASRKHIEKIVPVVDEALAGIGSERLDGVAVTCGPGLVGSLLVGLSFAKAFAYAQSLPLVGVNHLEAHVAAVSL
jgi:hypothetical protein